jgi:hypothetical protein
LLHSYSAFIQRLWEFPSWPLVSTTGDEPPNNFFNFVLYIDSVLSNVSTSRKLTSESLTCSWHYFYSTRFQGLISHHRHRRKVLKIKIEEHFISTAPCLAHNQLFSNTFTSIWRTCPAHKRVTFHTGGWLYLSYVEILAPPQSGKCNILGRIMFCNDQMVNALFHVWA